MRAVGTIRRKLAVLAGIAAIQLIASRALGQPVPPVDIDMNFIFTDHAATELLNNFPGGPAEIVPDAITALNLELFNMGVDDVGQFSEAGFSVGITTPFGQLDERGRDFADRYSDEGVFLTQGLFNEIWPGRNSLTTGTGGQTLMQFRDQQGADITVFVFESGTDPVAGGATMTADPNHPGAFFIFVDLAHLADGITLAHEIAHLSGVGMNEPPDHDLDLCYEMYHPDVSGACPPGYLNVSAFSPASLAAIEGPNGLVRLAALKEPASGGGGSSGGGGGFPQDPPGEVWLWGHVEDCTDGIYPNQFIPNGAPPLSHYGIYVSADANTDWTVVTINHSAYEVPNGGWEPPVQYGPMPVGPGGHHLGTQWPSEITVVATPYNVNSGAGPTSQITIWANCFGMQTE